MKNLIKNILNKLGIYAIVRKFVIKFYYPYKNKKMQKEIGTILKIVRGVLENNVQDYWLDYGTLLGYVREGKIIGHDLDLDFGLMPKEGIDLSKLFAKYDCKLIQQTFVDGKPTMETYTFKGVDFDLFYYVKKDDKIITTVWFVTKSNIPQRVAYKQGFVELNDIIFDGIDTKEIEFYGVKFRVPKDSDRYLRENYGDDYMIPNPNWKHEDEKNRVALNNVDFEVKFYS